MLKRFQQPKDWQWGTITNADQVKLHYGVLARHEKPVANIIIGPGLSEFAEKYFETAQILSRLHYNVYILHWRGQGGTAPYLADRFKRHSLGFDRDARDLIQFTDQKVPGNAPKVLLAHSMGGLIGLLAMVKVPGIFKAAIMTAPLLGFENRLAKGLEPVLARLPLPQKILQRYIPNGGPWKRRDDPTSEFKNDAFSSDPVRMKLHDHWMQTKAALRVGSPTFGFVREASRSIMTLRQSGVAEAIKTPTLVFTGGDDRIVSNTPIFNLAARLPHGALNHIPGAKHEILLEQDNIRRPVLKNIHSFIKAHLV